MNPSLPHRNLKIFFFAEPVQPCPRCGSLCQLHDTDHRSLIDIHLTYFVLLHVTVGVFCCPLCAEQSRPYTFREDIPFAFPRIRFTKRAVAKAVLSVEQDGMSLAKASERLLRDFCIVSVQPRDIR